MPTDPTPPGPKKWRDVVTWPPDDGQLCLVRRNQTATAPLHAIWSESDPPIWTLLNGWSMPWWQCWKWRPDDTTP